MQALKCCRSHCVCTHFECPGDLKNSFCSLLPGRSQNSFDFCVWKGFKSLWTQQRLRDISALGVSVTPGSACPPGFTSELERGAGQGSWGCSETSRGALKIKNKSNHTDNVTFCPGVTSQMSIFNLSFFPIKLSLESQWFCEEIHFGVEWNRSSRYSFLLSEEGESKSRFCSSVHR